MLSSSLLLFSLLFVLLLLLLLLLLLQMERRRLYLEHQQSAHQMDVLRAQLREQQSVLESKTHELDNINRERQWALERSELQVRATMLLLHNRAVPWSW